MREFLLGTLLGLLLIDLAGLVILRRAGGLIRLEGLSAAEFDLIGRGEPFRALPDTAFFRERLNDLSPTERGEAAARTLRRGHR